MSVTLDSTSAPFVRCGKNLNSVLTVATLVATNANRGLRWRLAESVFCGSLESGGRFCVGAFGRNLVSVTMKKFSHLIYFIKKFYKLCTFQGICKDNVAINCNRAYCSTQKMFIPVNFDGSYARLVIKLV
jgi:hypothetical protein